MGLAHKSLLIMDDIGLAQVNLLATAYMGLAQESLLAMDNIGLAQVNLLATDNMDLEHASLLVLGNMSQDQLSLLAIANIAVNRSWGSANCHAISDQQKGHQKFRKGRTKKQGKGGEKEVGGRGREGKKERGKLVLSDHVSKPKSTL